MTTMDASQAVTEAMKPPYNADGNPVFIWSQRRCSVPIRVFCPKCFAQLRVPSKMAGTNIDCACCHHSFAVNEDGNTTAPSVVEPLLTDDRPLAPRRQRNMDFKWTVLGTIVVFAVSLLLWIVFANLEAKIDNNGNEHGNGVARRDFPPLPARVKQHNLPSSDFVYDFTSVRLSQFLRDTADTIIADQDSKFLIVEYSVLLKKNEGIATGFAPLVLLDAKKNHRLAPVGWVFNQLHLRPSIDTTSPRYTVNPGVKETFYQAFEIPAKSSEFIVFPKDDERQKCKIQFHPDEMDITLVRDKNTGEFLPE